MPGPATAFATGVHGSRPANGAGCIIYSCTTHGLLYVDNGSSWSTYATLGGSTVDDATISTSDITTNNASTSKHGWLKKLDNTAAHYMDGTGAWTVPAGTGSTELSYVEFTSGVSITHTTEAAADTVVTSAAVSYSGSQRIEIEFCAEYILAPSGTSIFLYLYDGSSSIGIIGQTGNGVLVIGPVKFSRFLTPSNASHTYSIRASNSSGTGTVNAGAGGTATPMPGYIRITTA